MNLYRRTFRLLTPYWKQLVTASGSAALHGVLSAALVWVAGPLLSTLFQVGDFTGAHPALTDLPAGTADAAGEVVEGVATWIDSVKAGLKAIVYDLVVVPSRTDTLVNFCWLIMVIALLKNGFNYLQGFFMAFVQQSVIRSLREGLFEKYQRLSLSYFHRRRTGQIMSRVTNDVVVLNESIDISFNHLITDTIMAFMFFAFLLILSWKLTLMAMVILPVVFGFIWFVGKTLRRYSERSQRKMADVNSVLEEAVANTRIVKAFSTERFECRRFFKATGDYFRALLRMTRIRHLASPTNDTLITFAGVIILLYAGTKIITGSGELDAADFLTFIIAMFAMIKPVKSLSQIHIKIQEGLAAAERIFKTLEAPEVITEPETPAVLERFADRIVYDNVTFRYDVGETVLDSVSFEVAYGEVVAIVGPSGAGKSTILDLLPRFYDPQAGAVTIDGRDIRRFSLKSLRGLMGIVTQETLLFNDSVFNNIAYGCNQVNSEQVYEAARMANADRFIRELDQGYDTQVGNRGVMLSGGQRQRLAIARALLRNPQILIFDEATSALDTESEVLVQEAISRLMRDRTTLVVAHRLSTIINADRIVVIDRGRIVEEGRHEDLLRQGGVYHRLYTMQFRSDQAPLATAAEERE